MLLLGLAIVALTSKVPITFAAGLLVLLGLQVITLGMNAKTLSHIESLSNNDRLMKWIWKYFNLEKGILLGIIMILAGAFLFTFAWSSWSNNGSESLLDIKGLVFGMTLCACGVQTVFSSFFLSMMGMNRKK